MSRPSGTDSAVELSRGWRPGARGVRLSLAVLSLLLLLTSLRGQNILATFTLPEVFGVRWPTQNIEMRYDLARPDPKNTRMIGPDGRTEIPYQWVSGPSCWDETAKNGCILVQDGLTPNVTQRYILQAGVAPAAKVVNPVAITPATCRGGMAGWQISNGLTGFCVPKTQTAPYNYAPLQGIQLSNGAWTGAANGKANLIYESRVSNTSGVLREQNESVQGSAAGLHEPAVIFTSEATTILEEGPLKTSVRLSYSANRPIYWDAEGSLVAADAKTLTFKGGIFTPRSPAFIFANGGPNPPSPFSRLTVYYLSNCTATLTCSVSYTPGGPAITKIGAYNGPTPAADVPEAGGKGHYTATLTLYANRTSFSVDWDTDLHIQWFTPIYAEVHPDTRRYRGLGSSSVACGHEAPAGVTNVTNTSPPIVTMARNDTQQGAQVLISGVGGAAGANGIFYAKTAGFQAGTFALYTDSALQKAAPAPGAFTSGGTVKFQYGSWNNRGPRDAFYDISYTGNQVPQSQCKPYSFTQLGTNYPPNWPDAGWYDMVYDSAAGAAAPVVGIFQGRFSKLVNIAQTETGEPGWYASNAHWVTGARAFGIEEILDVPPTSGGQRHGNFGIYVDIAGRLAAPNSQQPIGKEQNALAGINLSSLYTYALTYADPPKGWQWPYMNRPDFDAWTALFKDGTKYCGSKDCYYNAMHNSDGYSRTIQDMWRYDDPAHTTAAYKAIAATVSAFVDVLANGDNKMAAQTHYYQLFLNLFQPYFPQCTAILMNRNATPDQKTGCKAILALGGSLVWDNDHWPEDNSSGDNGGLQNQQVQFMQYRSLAAAQLYFHPYLSQKVAAGASYTVASIPAMANQYGSAAASTHYQGTYTVPIYQNFQLAALNGQLSFASYPWKLHSQWVLSALTPPEPRFGNLRKCVSNGDGNTEGLCAEYDGMMAEGLSATDATAAGNAIWAWSQTNSSSTYTLDQTTIWSINPLVPPVRPALGSANFPGYWSVARYGFDTTHETSVHFINGGFYSLGGHRHADDGQVTIYAHNSPLAIDWNANLYGPQVPGRFMHNSIVFDQELKHAWSADNPSLHDADSLLGSPTNTEYAAFPDSTTSTATFTGADGTVWTRTARTMAFNSKYPVVYVYDSFSGPSAAAGKTLTWNLMASGAVFAPADTVTPVRRFSAGCQTVAGQLPSNGTVFPLAAGLQRFNFAGASWPRHPTGGISWDLYALPASSSAQFLIGNWGHGCQASREMGEFRGANGADFSETQDILRIHDTGPFTTIILPFRKTESPTRKVTQQPCGVQIVQGSETTCFNNSAATYIDSATSTSILTVYDKSPQSIPGATLVGGPQEVAVQSGQVVWTIGGVASGIRTLTLPGNWTPNTSLPHAGPVYTYNYTGGLQAAPVTIVFTQH